MNLRSPFRPLSPEATIYWCQHSTPLGAMVLAASDAGVAGAWFVGQKHFSGVAAGWVEDPQAACLPAAAQQLTEWFAGTRQDFDLPLAPAGTEFQRQVWAALLQIGHGQTRSYGELAAALGRPGSARAVGAATGRNPMSIIVPCHRLLAQGGALTGYAGGLERKAALLAFEADQQACG